VTYWSGAAAGRFLNGTGTSDEALALLEAAAAATNHGGFASAGFAFGGNGPALSEASAAALLERLGAFRNESWRVSDATWQSLARAFDQAGMTDTLYMSISLPDGSGPDFVAVKLLAWIKRDQKQIRPFIGELAEPTEKTQGDIRARWELARAYAVSLVEPQRPRRTDGNGHIRLALQASRSDTTLLMCLEELIAASTPTNSYTFPLQLLASAKDRFDGPTRQRLDTMEQQMRAAMTAAQAAATSTGNTTGGSAGNQTGTPSGQPNWQSIFDQKRQQLQRG